MPAVVEAGITRRIRRKSTPEERRDKRLAYWARTVHEINLLRKQGSARYNEADALLYKLLHGRPRLKVDRKIPYRYGTQVRIMDVYVEEYRKKESHKVYRAHGINQYELEVTDANGKVITKPD